MNRKELKAAEPNKKTATARSMWRIYELIPLQGSEKWSTHHKFTAAMTFVTCGSVNKTAKKTDIPRATIRQWMRSDWWPTVVEMCAELAAHKFAGRLNAIMDKALVALEERIEEGDVIITRSGRESVPVKAKDLMSIAASAATTKAKIKESSPSLEGSGSPTSRKLLDLSLALALVAQNAQAAKSQGTNQGSGLSKAEQEEIIDGEFSQTED